MDEKRKFLYSVMFSNAIQAAFQRIKIYHQPLSEKERYTFRRRLQDQVNALVQTYAEQEVNQSTHVNNIELIATANGLSFGVAQKLFNLYLKFLWCLGEVHTPPHCPVDSKILNKVDMPNVRWSRMNREQYDAVVRRIVAEAARDSCSSLSYWELKTFNDENYT